MATTLSNLCKLVNAVLSGATVGAANAIAPLSPKDAKQLELSGYLSRLDHLDVDLATAGYAKNGACTVALPSTTLVTVDLTDLTSATSASGGDTTFGTWNLIVLKNTGAAALKIAQGATNPLTLGLAGTTPTLSVPAGSSLVLNSAAGITIDSTHKTIDITPSATTSCSIAVGGA